METTQSVLERAYAFVEDMFGLQHENQTPHDPKVPEVPDAYTFQTVGEVSAEMRRRQDGE